MASTTHQPKIGIVFYSTYGHIGALAESVKAGAEAAGALVKVYQIQETLPGEVLSKMYAGGSLQPKYPVVKPDDLVELDGIIFGFPTRYGGAPAQVRAFFDQTGGLWAKGALVGKFGGMFTSTASQHGGQETTHLTTIPFFAHHGMAFVPIGYANPALNSLDEINGGSAYGASTIAGGQGERMPSAHELGVAKFQGESFSKFVGTFVRGKALLAQSANGTISTESAAHKELPAAGVAAAGAGAAGLAGTKGYELGEKDTELPPARDTTGLTGNQASAAPTAAGLGANTEKPAAPATNESSTAPAGTTTAPAATSTPAATSSKPAAAKPKKKGGLFSSCCGDKNID